MSEIFKKNLILITQKTLSSKKPVDVYSMKPACRQMNQQARNCDQQMSICLKLGESPLRILIKR